MSDGNSEMKSGADKSGKPPRRLKESGVMGPVLAAGIAAAIPNLLPPPAHSQEVASTALDYDHVRAKVSPGSENDKIGKQRTEIGYLETAFADAAIDERTAMKWDEFHKKYEEPMFNLSKAHGLLIRDYEQPDKSKPRAPHRYPTNATKITFDFEKKVFDLEKTPAASRAEEQKRYLQKMDWLETCIKHAIDLDAYGYVALPTKSEYAEAMTRARISGFYCGYFSLCPPDS